jgi:hypothetical protein
VYVIANDPSALVSVVAPGSEVTLVIIGTDRTVVPADDGDVTLFAPFPFESRNLTVKVAISP